MIRNHFPALLLVLSGLFLSNIVCAQSDILARFGGAYSVKNGPQQAQFVLWPKGKELDGTIVYDGRDYPLSATVDGLILKGVFGLDGNLIHFRMPLSTKRQFQVTFEGDEFGAWTFVRLPLPDFAGEFSGDFGRITLSSLSRGLLSGEYVANGSEQVVSLRGVSHGLEIELEGADDGKLFYSLEEKVYFVQIGGQFSQANHKTSAVLEAEHKAQLKRDNTAWQKALARATTSALDQYKEDWPNGTHVDEIPTIKEDMFWRKTLASDQIEDYLDYSRRYPKGMHIKMADDSTWRIVDNRNTDAAYSDYLKAFPQGRHRDDVFVIRERLAWAKAAENNRIKDYKSYAKHYPDGPHIKLADDNAWDIAQRRNTDAAYDAYLRAFPDGSYAGEVAQSKAKAQMARRDDKAFDVARRSDNPVGYRRYLQDFPDGRHLRAAQAGIDRHIAAAQTKKDDAAWRKALAGKSQSAIKQYMAAWPNGRHISEVEAAVEQIQTAQTNQQDDIAFATAQREDSISSYQRYLSQYRDGRHQQSAQLAINVFQKAVDTRVSFIRSVQSKLRKLGYDDQPLTGKLDNKTIEVILAFERAMKLNEKGQASDTLMQQLDAVMAFRSKLDSAKAGSLEDMVAVGNDLHNGTGVVADSTKAVMWYKKAAQGGNPEGMSRLGYSYIVGLDGNKDEKEGLKWLRKAVRFDNSEGMYQLALLYLQGIEVRKNSLKGVGWLVKSANSGRTESFDVLGDLYYRDNYGVGKNTKEAISWYQKGAQAELSSSMLNLGLIYMQGEGGIKKDSQKAFNWYQKAAYSDNAQGMYYLADMYEHGKGVEQNRSKAFEWYAKAAVKNDVRAQKRLREQGLSW